MQTPWGESETITVIGSARTGLLRVTTASHGGIYCTAEAWARIMRELPGFRPFAGPRWLEEDCDAAIAVALWPETASALARFHTWRMIDSAGTTGTAGVLSTWMTATPAGRVFASAGAEWALEHAGEWTQAGGNTTRSGGWRSSWVRVGDGARRSIETAGNVRLPALVSSADLDALAAQPAAPALPGCFRGSLVPAGGWSDDD